MKAYWVKYTQKNGSDRRSGPFADRAQAERLVVELAKRSEVDVGFNGITIVTDDLPDDEDEN